MYSHANGLEKTFARQSMIVAPLLYFVTGLILIGLDAGSHTWAADFSSFMERMIPSIASTASYSPQPDNARLILSLAWFLIPVYAVFLCVYDRGRSFRWEEINKRKKAAVFTVVVGPIFIVLMAVHTLTPLEVSTGRLTKFYYQIISSSPIFLLLWEAGYLVIFGLILYVSFWLPIETFRRTFLGR